jgi:26S proteasome regulatory subunit N5
MHGICCAVPQIHTELERARLTRLLSQMTEADGKVTEAAEILQEVQVASNKTV